MRTTSRKTPRISELSKQVGSRVTALRLEREWTQVELAIAGGLGQGFISRLEAGIVEPCLGVLDSLATAFDLSLSELLKGVG